MILGAPWFDRVSATMKFPERHILFHFRGKAMVLNVKATGNTIPYVNNSIMAKAIKSSLSCYLIFVKESPKDSNTNHVTYHETQEETEFSNFLHEFQDIFTDDIPRDLPP